ncbi:MAG: YdcF family protein [Clostridia bacterium]|nr:YdcF family protein [Clostridia bacterium]
MEQTNRPKIKRPFTLWHALGLVLILCTALAIWFGIHPRYRLFAVGVLLLGVFAAWKRDWMLWIVIAAEFVFVVFLWLFPQAGYKIASMVPLVIIGMLLVFRFCKKPVKIVVSIVAGICAAALTVIEIPIVRAAIEKPKPGADYIIVLGAAVYGEEPSITLQHRLEGAARYLDENRNTKAVVSGGQGAGEAISEAECMRRYLEKHGIAPERILIEDQSTSTKENLAFSKTVIKTDGGDVTNVAVVSSGYHLYRAKKTAGLLGMQATGVAGSDGYPLYMFGMYLREAAAVLKLWIFGM